MDNRSTDTKTNPIRLTRQQTAERFQVSVMTLHRWEKAGLLTPIRIEGTIRYRLEDIENLEKSYMC